MTAKAKILNIKQLLRGTVNTLFYPTCVANIHYVKEHFFSDNIFYSVGMLTLLFMGICRDAFQICSIEENMALSNTAGKFYCINKMYDSNTLMKLCYNYC